MSKESLPVKIDPFRSAAQALALSGHLLIKDMQRLTPELSNETGHVAVQLVFGMDERDICTIRGHLETTVVMQCQRCMEAMNYDIMSDFVTGVVRSQEEAMDLPADYVPQITEDGMLVIKDMIEDELIVDLPIVPMHDPEQCKVKMPFNTGSEEREVRDNPFNVISILRSKEDKK